MLMSAQMSLWSRKDVSGFLKHWLPGAVAVSGRTATPEPHDVSRNLESLRFFVTIWFAEEPKPGQAILEVEEAKATGNTGTAKMHATLLFHDLFIKSILTYQLKKEQDGWKIAGERGHQSLQAGLNWREELDERYFRKRDEVVEQQRKKNNLRELMHALSNAHRRREAHAVAKKITEQPGAGTADWVSRAEAALMAGEDADVVFSAKRARTRGPREKLPPRIEFAAKQPMPTGRK
jgi:hypothetical protein